MSCLGASLWCASLETSLQGVQRESEKFVSLESQQVQSSTECGRLGRLCEQLTWMHVGLVSQFAFISRASNTMCLGKKYLTGPEVFLCYMRKSRFPGFLPRRAVSLLILESLDKIAHGLNRETAHCCTKTIFSRASSCMPLSQPGGPHVRDVPDLKALRRR